MARRTQGVSAGLDRGRIAAAAVALIDRDGLEVFGVRRLAQELGVDPMSIYHHVKGKAALLDAVSEAVLAEVAAVPDDDTSPGWEEIARRTAHEYRAMAYRHPRIFPLLVTRAQTSAVAVSALERLVTAMRAAGVPDQAVADAPMVLFGFLNGHLLARTIEEPGAVPAFDAAVYPAMAALTPLMTDFGSTAEFDRMLGTVLDGIRRRAAPDRP
ncbi:TetR/AcrR family transcriptional regulator [Streptomyces tagetis]|uniref:TetR/AcrR family transcriptional regulator C-terminal domain-containing protein n=1 Tax=Streptomyces tagetis TaxID=2820809 RepID=A0A940X9K4_9ACTN|nr:TetR/AcrR family transcriptional regulator C-terminal domain-containing protein [Streptomyces sp. RG38]MBQ0825933.1 TetR/AcrR family transcriptional regulator C-terminal domain-containing protein [Streptomyces sp. RG38]